MQQELTQGTNECVAFVQAFRISFCAPSLPSAALAMGLAHTSDGGTFLRGQFCPKARFYLLFCERLRFTARPSVSLAAR